MTELVPIEPGQWVLAYVEHYYPGYFDGDMSVALEHLVEGGSGWRLHQASEQFDVLHVAHVMPKTFRAANGRRCSRYLVVAAARTDSELLALRDKLFSIGFLADKAIEEETARRMADFERATRADALAKVHAALPHIFGRPA